DHRDAPAAPEPRGPAHCADQLTHLERGREGRPACRNPFARRAPGAPISGGDARSRSFLSVADVTAALGVLLRKELHATFTSPIAYAIGAVFLLVMGYTFSLTLFFTKVANLTYIFHQMYVLLVLLTPVLTMRAFAEERRTDTL